MNKSKRPISLKLRKKMNKAIRNTQTGLPSTENRQVSVEETAQELHKLYPNRKTGQALVGKLKKGIALKKQKAHVSKRTSPGMADTSDSTPADAHREGKRWIKNLAKQTQDQRLITRHHDRKK